MIAIPVRSTERTQPPAMVGQQWRLTVSKHQCPSCGHTLNSAPKAKKSKYAKPYQYAEVIFADGVSILRGTYTGSQAHVAEGAVYIRALALSGGRWLNKANLSRVPAVEEVHWLAADEVEAVRDFAFYQRENASDGWGRNITNTEMWAPDGLSK